MKKPIAVISSFSIHHEYGSENEVGWRFVKLYVDLGYHVIVLYGAPHTSKLDELPGEYQPFIELVEVKFETTLRWFDKLHVPIQVAYYLWQIKLGLTVRHLLKDRDIAITHHVSWVKATAPSFLWLLDAPFIWGPVGGLEVIPSKLYHGMSVKSKFKERLRSLSIFLSKFDPFVRLTAMRADVIISVNEQTSEFITKKFNPPVDIHYMPAIGIDDLWNPEKTENHETTKQSTTDSDAVFKIIAVGRLLEWKGFHLLIQAVEMLKFPWQLDIYGDGPDAKKIKQYLSDNRITFHGNVSQGAVIQAMKSSDCFILPTLRDSGGAVFIEAAQHHLPVISLDLGGPGSYMEDIHHGAKIQTQDQSAKDVILSIKSKISDLRSMRDNNGSAISVQSEQSTIESSSMLFFSNKKSLLTRIHESLS